jgi:hypothetical protein
MYATANAVVVPTQKPFVFVLMPFDSAFDDIYRYGIKKACEDQGAYCERVDEQLFDGTILDRIYNQIAHADLIVADMTGRNPNVFYEAGYAHALGKRVILLTQDSGDIPFDLKHYTHIVYNGSISSLADQLSPRISWALTNISSHLTQDRHVIRYQIQGIKLDDGVQADIVEYFDDVSRSLCRVLQLDIFNDSQRTIRQGELDIGIVLDCYTGRHASRTNDGRYWHVLTGIGDILPAALRSIRLLLEIPDGVDHERLTMDGVRGTLREISTVGNRNIEFVARLRSRESLEFLHNHDVARLRAAQD